MKEHQYYDPMLQCVEIIITADNGRPQVKFCVCVGLPVQMHAEQIEVGSHFVCISVAQIYLVLLQESGLIFTHKCPLFDTQIGLLTALFNLAC